ncbi:MAG TPA: hypothetical protein VGI06_10950, partial [Acidimicrobiales bacterium]
MPDTEPEAPEPESEATEVEAERHAGALLTRSRGQEVLHPSLDTYVETITALWDEGFDMCV